jgi:hypothetical protein
VVIAAGDSAVREVCISLKGTSSNGGQEQIL